MPVKEPYICANHLLTDYTSIISVLKILVPYFLLVVFKKVAAIELKPVSLICSLNSC